jgi:hypothetical protein
MKTAKVYQYLRRYLYKYNISLPYLKFTNDDLWCSGTSSNNTDCTGGTLALNFGYNPKSSMPMGSSNYYYLSPEIRLAKELNPYMFFPTHSNYYSLDNGAKDRFDQILYFLNTIPNPRTDTTSNYSQSLTNTQYNNIMNQLSYIETNVQSMLTTTPAPNYAQIVTLTTALLYNIDSSIKYPTITFTDPNNIDTATITPVAPFTNYNSDIDKQNYTRPSLKEGFNTGKRSFLDENYNSYE